MDNKIHKGKKKARQNQHHISALYSEEVNRPHDRSSQGTLICLVGGNINRFRDM